MTLSLEWYLHGSLEPYTQFSHAKMLANVIWYNSAPQWSRFQVNRYDSKGQDRRCWLFSVLLLLFCSPPPNKQLPHKMKKKTSFYILYWFCDFDKENTFSVSQNVATKCADSILFDMEPGGTKGQCSSGQKYWWHEYNMRHYLLCPKYNQSMPKYNQPRWRWKLN